MSRFFVPISKQELENKVIAFANDGAGNLDIYELVNKLHKDLKVKFDLENWNDDGSPHGLTGLCTLHNGLTFWGFSASGDWENSVFFIVYFDGKKIRAYVPTEGNTWNSITKEAYGNDEDKDLEDIEKRFPGTPSPDDLIFDGFLLRKDIESRILPAVSKPVKPKKVKKPLTVDDLDKLTNKQFLARRKEIIALCKS